jgi:hypothetical protein
VELALDEEKRLCSPRDGTSFCLVGGKLPFIKPLKDQKPLVGISKIQLGWLVNHHDFGFFNL